MKDLKTRLIVSSVAAVAVALTVGISVEKIKSGLKSFAGVMAQKAWAHAGHSI